MMEIILTIIFLAVMATVTIVALFFSVRRSNQNSDTSKYIINRFEPDNTAPKITDLIEFSKSNEEITYKIN